MLISSCALLARDLVHADRTFAQEPDLAARANTARSRVDQNLGDDPPLGLIHSINEFGQTAYEFASRHKPAGAGKVGSTRSSRASFFSGKRYGHQNSYRHEFMIQQVEGSGPVSRANRNHADGKGKLVAEKNPVSSEALFVQAGSSKSFAAVVNSRYSESDSVVVQEGPSLAKNDAIKAKRRPAKPDSPELVKGISRSRAITIARRKALRSYKSLRRFNVVPCEQVRFWRVIYDGGGPEYVIDKLSGRIIRSQVLPQGSKIESAGQPQTGRDRAIQVATTDAEKTYEPKGEAVSQYAVFACELTNSWRVVFDYKMHTGERLVDFPNAGFPKYVIEKGTGKIIHKQLN
jgi:hypothetical protein